MCLLACPSQLPSKTMLGVYSRRDEGFDVNTDCSSGAFDCTRGFSKFVWLIADSLPIEHIEQSLRATMGVGETANLHRIMNGGAPFSSAIYAVRQRQLRNVITSSS